MLYVEPYSKYCMCIFKYYYMSNTYLISGAFNCHYLLFTASEAILTYVLHKHTQLLNV